MQTQLGQWTTASSKGDVYLCLGFVPDYVRLILDAAGTNPNVVEWFNPATMSLAAAKVLVTTGSTGVNTVDADAGDIVTAYDGGDKMTTTQVATDDPKYVDHNGVLIALGKYTPAGIWIADEYQVNSGVNFCHAVRRA